ncbi:MAG: AMP-binding protein [Thermoanaerobaculia bacterium]|nr:AMP-binding protein [Thermoanaerobaculia bacterium]
MLWLPQVLRFPIVYYVSPVDARAIGGAVAEHGVTHLFTTPTFMESYTRRVDPWQFGSLRFVITGAEKLREATAEAFWRRFGIRPFQGYGCTETSPVVACSTLDHRGRNVYQMGSKANSVGRVIPGTCVRVVDPATWEDRGEMEEGLLRGGGA